MPHDQKQFTTTLPDTLPELFHQIEARGWEWLIRSDADNGSFANVVVCRLPGTQAPERKDTFPTYGPEPYGTLGAAYVRAIRGWQPGVVNHVGR